MTGALIAAGAALLIAWALTRAFCRGAGPALMDHPNERSLHEVPTPRTGGLAIVAGIAAGHALLALWWRLPPGHGIVIGCTALVFVVSVADDVRHVAPLARIAVHALAAAGLVAAGLVPGHLVLFGQPLAIPAALGVPLTVLFVVWMTNLYNFMDGMDGFAGGMGVIGFGACAALAARGGAADLAGVALLVAASCGGFMAFNFPPARIFMGDAGSSVLGFLAAWIALAGERSGAFEPWLAVLVFSPFVVDATVTLLRRLLAGERVWEAHRSHFYQRLVRLGWGHRRTTLSEYVLMLACALSAIALQRAPAAVQLAALCAWAVIYVILMLYVSALERSRQRNGSEPPDRSSA